MLATKWVVNAPVIGARYYTVTQGATYYIATYDENRDPGQEAYAYRNFGVAGSSILTAAVDIYFEGDTSIRQAAMIVGASATGAGVGVVYEQGVLSIRKYSQWGAQFFNAVLDTASLTALNAAQTYNLRASVQANADGTKTVVASIYSGVTQLSTLTSTGNFDDGDYCGFANGTSNDASTQYITRYDNYTVMASGSTGVNVINVSTSYVYTFVNTTSNPAIRWESAPSPASDTILRPDGVSVTVTTPVVIPGGTDPLYQIDAKRIYRAVTGATGTIFLLVAEIPLATATYLDILDDSKIGPDVLESEDWDLPPATMEGILALPNGIMAGFFRNQLCLSVQGRPHAWPIKYRLPTDTDIVAIANIDNTIVIGTKSFVYTATGNDPANYSMSQPGAPQACLSKRSMKYLDQIGVVFSSPDGMMLTNGSAGHVQNITGPFFTRRQWQALVPTSILCGVHDGVLHFFYTGTTPDAGYALDAKSDGFGMVRLSYHSIALHADPLTDNFYEVVDVNNEPTHGSLPVASTAIAASNKTIFQFDAAGSDMVFLYRGRLNLLPNPTAPQRARVQALNYTNLLARFYGDGTLLYTKVITNGVDFSLPTANQYDTYEIELIGTSTTRKAQVVEDAREFT